jgi:hypothetical protein
MPLAPSTAATDLVNTILCSDPDNNGGLTMTCASCPVARSSAPGHRPPISAVPRHRAARPIGAFSWKSLAERPAAIKQQPRAPFYPEHAVTTGL